jgi:uncharacterized protein YjiS (DUF1127 family)
MSKKAADRPLPDGWWWPQEIRIWWPHPVAFGPYVSAWRARLHDRRLLARLDDCMLRDIGIDRGLVDDDSTASFWRLR